MPEVQTTERPSPEIEKVLGILETRDNNRWHYLKDSAWGEWEELTRPQQGDVLAFIGAAFSPTKQKGGKRCEDGAYGLKHRFEFAEGGFYLNEWQFIVAMLLSGYELSLPPKSGPWSKFFKTLYYTPEWQFSHCQPPKWPYNVSSKEAGKA